MLQNICFVDNIKIRRQIVIGLPLFGFEKNLNVFFFSGFSNVISTRETGTQHMLLIDPDDEEEEHMVESTSRCKLEEKQGEN